MNQPISNGGPAPIPALHTADVDVSIVIPVKDGQEMIETLLKSIVENGPADIRYEIIVADDGSSVDLGPVCDRYGAVQLRSETSLGPADARNRGADASGGDLLLFLDADVVYTSGVIERAILELDRDADLHAVSFLNQRYDEGANVVANYCAAIEQYWFTAYLGEDLEIADVEGFASRNGAVRKQAFDAVGGFDVSFKTNAMEDYDFGKRLRAEFRTAMVRTPVLYHNFPVAIGRLLRNYFVRTSLFVPYYLKKRRPALDRVQSSPAEAMLRMSGLLGLFFLAVPVFGVSPLGLWLVLSLVCMCGYLYGVRDFLKAARRWSNGVKFPIQAFFIHYMSTVAIACGGAVGLLSYIGGRLFSSDRSES